MVHGSQTAAGNVLNCTEHIRDASRTRPSPLPARPLDAYCLDHRAWNPAAYAALRDCTVAEAALALAAAGRLGALPVLLQRHPRALLPSVLDALSAIPETAEVKQYAPLLRQVGVKRCAVMGPACPQQEQQLWGSTRKFGWPRLPLPRPCHALPVCPPVQIVALRQPLALERSVDWVESEAVAAELREEGEYALLLATEPMCAISTGWRPPTGRQLAQWVCQRAQQLDAATGQLPNAAALLEAGQAALHYGQPSVSALLGTAHEVLSLVKLGKPGANSHSSNASACAGSGLLGAVRVASCSM